jgi:putative flippase GtrA
MRIDVLRFLQDKIRPTLYRRSIEKKTARLEKMSGFTSTKLDDQTILIIDGRSKKEISRSLITGILCNAVDFSIYYLLINICTFNISKGISFACAGIVGYLLNKYWAFERGLPSYAEGARYAFISVLALGINIAANQSLLNIWPHRVMLALVIASITTGLFAFICFKWWVFRTLLQEAVYFAWWKFFPWKFLIRDAARKQGFLDPIELLSQLQNFAQPSEVAAPTELLRSGVVLHARGLINSLAIQHNLDWVWPFWVECQYNPRNEAFIPRSFSLTQINLTHRNWTALGVPDSHEFPLVDPRGLVTPFYDGWSLDVWIIPGYGKPLIPSRAGFISQEIAMDDTLCVITEANLDQLKLKLKAEVIGSSEAPLCQVRVSGSSSVKARLIVSLRPYNPEGISFIHNISLHENSLGWQVDRERNVYFDKAPDQCILSDYRRGDVYGCLSQTESDKEVSCTVGMASAAAVYTVEAGGSQEVTLSVPLTQNTLKTGSCRDYQETAQISWGKSLEGACSLQIPDKHFKFLYDAAISTMILHSPKEVYPGPYIYRRFWFRDAAFILQGLLCVGLKERVRRALDCFRGRQTLSGYFLSQEGEWDSNGEALWIMKQYCALTGQIPPKEWQGSINKAGEWICKKRLPQHLKEPHAGLLPSGFSAEHLGPNDFYYWDDFWSVSGLQAAASLSVLYKDHDKAAHFQQESLVLKKSIEQSLAIVNKRLKKPAIPASPYRRMDSGAIGSLVASYPLHIVGPKDPAVLGTADFLMNNCLVHGGFFHDMTHSGINPYLTLHLAQVLLRAGDARYFGLMTAVANLASSTGQWPESIHPRTGGGCMGDGQHVWAAAEWVLMIRNCFVREEGEQLILCSGIPQVWQEKKQNMSFGPAPTRFGDIQICIRPQGKNVLIEWQGKWFVKEPVIDIHLPCYKSVRVLPGTNFFELKDRVAP